ncbi:MAG: peptide chain release factor N(5)-glutamine methyltransferase [Bdellovibrionales bacterium]|nr:peptide chain release factor N(5)-glutamine methyltransferase [Bdellovibrionales bacterium]
MKLEAFRKDLVEKLNLTFGSDSIYEVDRLLAEYFNWKPLEILRHRDFTISEGEQKKLEGFAERRLKGEPLEYIFGHSYFMELNLSVGPGVLIPRQDSEAMVFAGIEHLRNLEKNNSLKAEGFFMADLGAGSGALGLSILSKYSFVHCEFYEKSTEALPYLETNINFLGMQSRSKVCKQNLQVEDLPLKKFDLILANPPYIDRGDMDLDRTVKNFEPAEALFAEDEGYEKIFNWTEKALAALKNQGCYLCEIGWKQSERVETWSRQVLGPEMELSFGKDLSGHVRYFSLRQKG